jgi:sulfide dehydrogenase cytochrome subunit
MRGRGAISMRGALSLGAALGMLAVPAVADGPPGAAACSGCHAPAAAGLPVPSLEGRTVESILADMRAFRSGEKPATVMDRIAKGFSDEEARAIAEWLAKRDHAAIQP